MCRAVFSKNQCTSDDRHADRLEFDSHSCGRAHKTQLVTLLLYPHLWLRKFPSKWKPGRSGHTVASSEHVHRAGGPDKSNLEGDR